jgi:hypothetical protein
MNSSMNYLLPALALLVVCSVIGGCFWGGHHAARRLVEDPVAIVFLTLLFGAIFTAIVASGLVAGCMMIAGSPSFR